MVNPMLDPAVWRRTTRGRRRDFPGLTQVHVIELLADLPPRWPHYALVSCELVKVGVKYEPLTRLIDARELDLAAEQGDWNFFIFSGTLSPWLTAALPGISAAALSLNGCISLQYGRRYRDSVEPASLAHVPVVANSDGDQVRFDEYGEVFDKAVRTARKLTRALT